MSNRWDNINNTTMKFKICLYFSIIFLSTYNCMTFWWIKVNFIFLTIKFIYFEHPACRIRWWCQQTDNYLRSRQHQQIYHPNDNLLYILSVLLTTHPYICKMELATISLPVYYKPHSSQELHYCKCIHWDKKTSIYWTHSTV